MRKTFILYCFCLLCFGSIAQKEKSVNAISITKEEAMKFKTINGALGISNDYKVLHYDLVLIAKDAVIKPLHTNDISLIFSNRQIGTEIIFENILLKKGDRQIKLDDKVYVIK